MFGVGQSSASSPGLHREGEGEKEGTKGEVGGREFRTGDKESAGGSGSDHLCATTGQTDSQEMSSCLPWEGEEINHSGMGDPGP